MTTNARTRRVSSPAYYLARPAALWLAAFAPRPQPRPADRASCTSEGRGSTAHSALGDEPDDPAARERLIWLRVPPCVTRRAPASPAGCLRSSS